MSKITSQLSSIPPATLDRSATHPNPHPHYQPQACKTPQPSHRAKDAMMLTMARQLSLPTFVSPFYFDTLFVFEIHLYTAGEHAYQIWWLAVLRTQKIYKKQDLVRQEIITESLSPPEKINFPHLEVRIEKLQLEIYNKLFNLSITVWHGSSLNVYNNK